MIEVVKIGIVVAEVLPSPGGRQIAQSHERSHGWLVGGIGVCVCVFDRQLDVCVLLTDSLSAVRISLRLTGCLVLSD